ncbi:MAG TPA: hypothetical protein VJ728_01235 [Candidatus Binataceae bacterium]|nr:hypothetical protein [Candidatus Binataceae bacterium]
MRDKLQFVLTEPERDRMILEPAALKVGMITSAAREWAFNSVFKEFGGHEEIAANDRTCRAARGKMLVAADFAVGSNRGYCAVAFPEVRYQSRYLAPVGDVFNRHECLIMKVPTHYLDPLGTIEADDWHYLHPHLN